MRMITIPTALGRSGRYTPEHLPLYETVESCLKQYITHVTRLTHESYSPNDFPVSAEGPVPVVVFYQFTCLP